MSVKSYWESSSKTFDVVIIGAGFLGSWTAYELSKDKNLTIAVIESSSLSHGASTKNAGFACFGSATELLGDIRLLGKEKSLEITQKRLNGINKIRRILGESVISFDNCGGYELFLQDDICPKESNIQELNDLLQSSLSIQPFSFLTRQQISSLGFSNNVESVIANPLEGSINPIKALETLHTLAKTQGVQFFFRTQFRDFDAENGTISVVSDGAESVLFSKKVIHCTNAFTKQLDIAPGRGQVFITSVIENLPLRGTFHYDEGYVYFRNVDSNEGRKILIGGGRNKDFTTEESLEFVSNPLIIEYLQQFLSKILPSEISYTIEQSWTGIMGFSKDKLPIVKEVSPNEFVGFACNGMGVALTPIISEELATLVKSSL